MKINRNISHFFIIIIILNNNQVYSYSCWDINKQLKKIYNSEELSLHEKEFKSNNSKECHFYIGKKYYELRRQDPNKLKNAEELFQSAADVLAENDRNYSYTFYYLLLIEIEKQTPNINKIKNYYDKLKNRISNKEKKDIQQKIQQVLGDEWKRPDNFQDTNTMELVDVSNKDTTIYQQDKEYSVSPPNEYENQKNSQKIMQIKEEDCWKHYKNYDYRNSKNCFELYLSEIVNVNKCDEISKRVTFLEDIIKRKEIIIENYSRSCDEKTYNQNLSDIETWFRDKGALGKYHWFYSNDSSDKDHTNRLKVINILAYKRCLDKSKQNFSSFEIVNQAKQLNKYFIKDELSEYNMILSKAEEMKTEKKLYHDDKDLTVKKSNSKINNKKINGKLRKNYDYNNYEYKAWSYFKRYMYPEAIDTLTLLTHQINYDFTLYNEIYEKINFIKRFEEKKNKLKNTYKKYCHYKTNKSNSNDINQWFESSGDLSPMNYDYPDDSPVSNHQKHLHALNWIYFGKCRETQQVYLRWFDIYKKTYDYSNNLNLYTKYGKYEGFVSTDEAEKILLKIGTCEDPSNNKLKLKVVFNFINKLIDRWEFSDEDDKNKYNSLLHEAFLCIPPEDRKRFEVVIEKKNNNSEKINFFIHKPKSND